jgi:hypothetical protein
MTRTGKKAVFRMEMIQAGKNMLKDEKIEYKEPINDIDEQIKELAKTNSDRYVVFPLYDKKKKLKTYYIAEGMTCWTRKTRHIISLSESMRKLNGCIRHKEMKGYELLNWSSSINSTLGMAFDNFNDEYLKLDAIRDSMKKVKNTDTVFYMTTQALIKYIDIIIPLYLRIIRVIENLLEAFTLCYDTFQEFIEEWDEDEQEDILYKNFYDYYNGDDAELKNDCINKIHKILNSFNENYDRYDISKFPIGLVFGLTVKIGNLNNISCVKADYVKNTMVTNEDNEYLYIIGSWYSFIEENRERIYTTLDALELFSEKL